jgi:hypothetical protein
MEQLLELAVRDMSELLIGRREILSGKDYAGRGRNPVTDMKPGLLLRGNPPQTALHAATKMFQVLRNMKYGLERHTFWSAPLLQ